MTCKNPRQIEINGEIYHSSEFVTELHRACNEQVELRRAATASLKLAEDEIMILKSRVASYHDKDTKP